MNLFKNKSFNKINFFSFFFISLILFIILNLFFYSFISIGLYKFICYEKQNNLLKLFYFNKSTYNFFYYFNNFNFNLINTSYFYKVKTSFLYVFLPFNNFFFYDLLSILKIKFFFFSKDFVNINISKNLNLIFLNFYIRSSNLN